MQSVRNIIQLRQLLAERFPGVRTLAELPPARAPARQPTGVPSMDALLGGGLPKGGLVELVSAHTGAGGALLLPRLLQQAHAAGHWLALIDGVDSFDPTPLDPAVLSRLLWARCRDAAQALKAADLLLRDGNLSLVLLDLQINPASQLRKIPGTVWYRLQRLIERTSIALLVLTPRVLVPSAQTRLVLRGRFSLESLGQSSEELLARLQFTLAPRRVAVQPAVAMAEAG
jgi:hypothetical protein